MQRTLLNKAALHKGKLKKRGSGRYEIKANGSGIGVIFHLSLEPSDSHPHIELSFTPDKWSTPEVDRISNSLASSLGADFMKDFFLHATVSDIKVVGDIPPSVNPNNLALGNAGKVYSNIDGQFWPIPQPQYHCKLIADAYYINAQGDTTISTEPNATQIALAMNSYPNKPSIKIKNLYKIIEQIDIFYIPKLAETLPGRILHEGQRKGLIDATQGDEKLRADYNHSFNQKRQLTWPPTFDQLWIKLLKPINKLILAGRQSG